MDQTPSPGQAWTEPAAPEPGDPTGGPDPTGTSAMPPLPTATAVPPAPVTARKGRSGTSLGTIALILAGALAVGGVAFAAGRLTAPATAAAGTGRFGNGQFPGGAFPSGGVPNGGAGFARGEFGPSIQGTVESIDASSITIKLADGQTTTIKLDGSTTYSEQTSSSASAVAPGSTVIVRVGFAGAGGPNASPGANPSPGASLGTGTARSVTVVK